MKTRHWKQSKQALNNSKHNDSNFHQYYTQDHHSQVSNITIPPSLDVLLDIKIALKAYWEKNTKPTKQLPLCEQLCESP